MPERIPSLDALRIAGAFAVVMLHVSAGVVGTVDVSSLGWWVANLSNAASRWGDAIIMMTGGALLLGRASGQAPLGFAMGRFARLLPAAVFWTLFYLLWRAWRGELPAAGEVVVELLRGTPYYHLWFLYMMLGMYLALPLVGRLVNGEDRRLAYYFLGLCCVLTPVEGLMRGILEMSHASFLSLFPLYLVYFVGGYLLYRDRPQASARMLAGTAVLCIVLVAAGVAVLHPVLGERVFKFMYTNRGPLVIVTTFSLFLLALRVLPEHDSGRARWLRLGRAGLARVTLGIYAIHPFWIVVLADRGWSAMHHEAPWAVPAYTVLIFALSAATALAFAWLPGLRRVVV